VQPRRAESSLSPSSPAASALATPAPAQPALAQPVAAPQPQTSLAQPRGFETSDAIATPAAPSLALPPPPAIAVPLVPVPPAVASRPVPVVTSKDPFNATVALANSTSRMAPYALKVTINTNELVQQAVLTITTDEPVVTASITTDPRTRASGRVDKTHYRIVFDRTGFKPDQPITLLLMSANPIQELDIN
jgi:hypothetical protein